MDCVHKELYEKGHSVECTGRNKGSSDDGLWKHEGEQAAEREQHMGVGGETRFLFYHCLT